MFRDGIFLHRTCIVRSNYREVRKTMLAGHFRRSQHGEIINPLEGSVAIALERYPESLRGGLLIRVTRAVLHRAIWRRAGTNQHSQQEHTQNHGCGPESAEASKRLFAHDSLTRAEVCSSVKLIRRASLSRKYCPLAQEPFCRWQQQGLSQDNVRLRPSQRSPDQTPFGKRKASGAAWKRRSAEAKNC